VAPDGAGWERDAMADRARLHRSELAVPGTNTRAMEKAPTLGADLVFLDLEDAVAPDDKEQARSNVIEALRAHDWSSCAISVRINGLDTHWCYRDVVDVVEACGDVLDTVLVPKVGSPSDVEFVATLLDQIEQRRGLEPGRIGIHILIETAKGMANVEAISRARPDRLEAMVFGVADYAASVQARTTNIGGANPDYSVLTDADAGGERASHWGDQWHFGISRMVAACRAEGLRPIDGPFGDFGDADGYRAAARRAAALGCEGKWAIHPSQVELANEVFTPAPAEVDRAGKILQAMEDAAKEGKGAVSLDGRLIDAASIRMAQNLMRKVEQMRAR
jgi:malyl-CoA/(S)-citramalyl-CoA lyase